MVVFLPFCFLLFHSFFKHLDGLLHLGAELLGGFRAVALSFPCASPGASGRGWEEQSHVPSLAPVPLRVTATALGVPWVTEGHTHLKAALCKGKGVVLGIPVGKEKMLLLSLPPPASRLCSLSHSWCARPLCPRPGAIPHPLRVWAGPPVGWALLPVGWEFLPAEPGSGRWKFPTEA